MSSFPLDSLRQRCATPLARPSPDALRDAGWTKGGWSGIEPATFEALPEGGLRLTAQAQASFVWRPVDKGGECLSWRWRVDAGPPPTPLDRRGGDDRAIAITSWHRSARRCRGAPPRCCTHALRPGAVPGRPSAAAGRRATALRHGALT